MIRALVPNNMVDYLVVTMVTILLPWLPRYYHGYLVVTMVTLLLPSCSYLEMRIWMYCIGAVLLLTPTVVECQKQSDQHYLVPCEVYGQRGTYTARQGDEKRLKCSWNDWTTGAHCPPITQTVWVQGGWKREMRWRDCYFN
eukprot:sb/3474209/